MKLEKKLKEKLSSHKVQDRHNNVRSATDPEPQTMSPIEVVTAGPSHEETAYERLLRQVQEKRSEERTEKDLEVDALNKSYDGMQVNINASDDDFSESEPEPESDEDPDNVETLENSQAASLNKTRPETRQDSTQAKFESWRNDPDFKMFVAEIVSETRQLDRAESDSGQQTGGRELPNKGKSVKQNVNQGKDGQMAQIKSPSDTTIYKPAFRTAMENTNDAIAKKFLFRRWYEIRCRERKT